MVVVGAGGVRDVRGARRRPPRARHPARREERLLRRLHRALRRWRVDPRQLRAARRRPGGRRRRRGRPPLPRLDRGEVVPKVRRDTYLPAAPRCSTSCARPLPCASAGCPSTPTTCREPRRPRPRTQRRAGADGCALPRPRARAAAPAVHEVHRPTHRHPGRLPQDQPGAAHRSRPITMAKVLVKRLVAIALGRRMVRWATRSRCRFARAWPTPACRWSTRPRSRSCSSRTAAWSRRRGARRRAARGAGPAGRRPRVGRVRAQPGAAREVPAPAHLDRLVHGGSLQHWAPACSPAPRRARHRPPGRRVVGPHDPRSRVARGSAWPSATCPARSS